MNLERLRLVGFAAVACGCSSSSSPSPSLVSASMDGSSSGEDAAGSGFDANAEGPDGARLADATVAGSDAAGSPSPEATIHYLGRFDTSDAAGARFAYPGSAIAATFQGTGIQVKLTDSGTNYFSVVVDGAAPVKLATSGSSKTYTLASGLPASTHSVVLTKRTESFVGVVQFLGFTVQGGALLLSPEPFSRRIEYVGDSITCGYGNLGAGPTCKFSDDTEDETLAYGALAAAQLNAQQTVIAYSGKGMYRDNQGTTTNQMPVLFGRVLADDTSSAWAFQTPPPDVVVINLSTNDFAPGDPGSAFTTAYTAFLHQVRQKYPNAEVICTQSPMMSGPSRATAMGYIESAVHSLNAGGDAKVALLELPGDAGGAADGGASPGFAEQQSSDGYGCDYHPSTKTDQVMAATLVAQIRRVTGW